MVQAQADGMRLKAFRLAALILAVLLIFLGTANFFKSSLASTVEEEDPDYPTLFEDVQRNLKMHYLDQDRVGPRARKLTERALSMLENMVDEIYVENSDPDNPHVKVHVGDKVKVVPMARISDLDDAVAVLKDLDEFFKANYRGKHTINEIRYYEMNGFLSGLDPHTQVFNPKGFKDFSVHIEGEIFGVGMYVGSVKGTLTVKNVLPGTPAERAGFKRGDRIVKIGEESTVNMDVTEAVKKIRGPEHSKVVLTVKRKESKNDETLLTLPIEVHRERVTIPSVVAKLLPLGRKGEPAAEGGKGGRASIGYVQVTNFDKNTVPSLKEGLETLRAENGGRDPDGLILDLRENSGGLLQQASDMADLFLPKGELYWIAQKNREEVKEARNDRREPRYPMVVLGNELSASGAEIVIGALQKNHRAVVLGTPTFGKGSVQQLHPLLNDWQLKITVSEYLIPGKISIQENGVVPDILADRVVISDKLNNLFPNRRLGTERDYDEHIVSRFKKDEEPAERIQYLSSDPVDPEVEDPDAPEPIIPGEIDPDKDTLAQIGLDLLRIAIKDGEGSGDQFRSEVFLRRHAAEIDGVRKDRFAEIVKRLQDRGIEWEDGTNPESARVELTVEHRQIQKPSADKEDVVPKPYLVLTARATNRSDRPVFRTKAITRCDSFSYRDLEFLFGKINPGATVERTVEVPIPYYPFARNDLVQFTVSGSNGKSILEHEHEVVLAAADRPAFGYLANLVSKDKKEPVRQLAPSSEAVLQLKITNTGKATAHKGVAILRNQTGPEVFLEPPGRIEFTELEPGQSKNVEFAFRIIGNSTRKSYRFELGMVDSYSGESLTREVEISAAGSDGPGFPTGQEFHPPEILATITDTDSPAGDDLPKPILVTDRAEVNLIAKVQKGQAPFNAWVTDSPLGLKDSDPDKVFFAASRGTEDLRFTARVPLKKGTNMIHVVATDENGLQNREVLVIRRKVSPVAGKLTERIEEAAQAVYAQLGPGFGKGIYEAALPGELRKRGLRFEVKPQVGQHELDLLVENEVLVKLNVKDSLGENDSASLLSVLKLAGKQHGLVVNFSGPKLETKRVEGPEVARGVDR